MMCKLTQSIAHRSSIMFAIALLLFCNRGNAMSFDVVRHIDLSNLGGQVVVPRPCMISVPMDLGEEDLPLQNILQNAEVQIIRDYFGNGNNALNVNALIQPGWTWVEGVNFTNLRNALQLASPFERNLRDLFMASVNHNIGPSVAATLFAHMVNLRHVWHRYAAVANADLHFLAWVTAIRVLDANNIPNTHSSFLINEDMDALSFFSGLISSMREAVRDNISNLRVDRQQNTIFIEISLNPSTTFEFVSFSPNAVIAAVPHVGFSTGLARLRAFIPAGALNYQQKADAIRDIANYIGTTVFPGGVVPLGIFPVQANGTIASVNSPQRTNRVRVCINAQGANPYVASMFPLPR